MRVLTFAMLWYSFVRDLAVELLQGAFDYITHVCLRMVSGITEWISPLNFFKCGYCVNGCFSRA